MLVYRTTVVHEWFSILGTRPLPERYTELNPSKSVAIFMRRRRAYEKKPGHFRRFAAPAGRPQVPWRHPQGSAPSVPVARNVRRDGRSRVSGADDDSRRAIDFLASNRRQAGRVVSSAESLFHPESRGRLLPRPGTRRCDARYAHAGRGGVLVSCCHLRTLFARLLQPRPGKKHWVIVYILYTLFMFPFYRKPYR